MRQLLARLVTFLRRDRAEHELARELAAHLALLEADYERNGMMPEEARLAARRAIGGIEQTKERQRDARSFVWLEDLRRDLRHTLRSLKRTPGFTAVATLTLALGIGANTAIFSVIDAALLRTLPIPAPEQLMVLDAVTARGERQNVSYPLFLRLREERTAFAGVAAALDGFSRLNVGSPEWSGETVRADVQLVSGEYFDVLGVRAALGRALDPGDDSVGAEPVAVLSEGFWTRRHAADAHIVGKIILIKNQPVTIVGVAPRGFFGEAVGRVPDIWVPLVMQPRFDAGRSLLNADNVGWLQVFARLAPGVDENRAEAALALGLERLHAQTAGPARNVASIGLSDGSKGLPEFRERFSLPLRILAGIVALVLLMACANVANLLLARASARQREMAVRLAIGAGRRRLIRQLLTESLMLATAGGVCGLLLAVAGSRFLLVLASGEDVPVFLDVSLDVKVLAFAAVASVAAVVVSGVAPALIASSLDVGTSLKIAAERRVRGRLPRLLIVAQVALSLLLLTAGALFIQTLRNLRTRDLGFADDALLQVNIATGLDAPAIRERIPQLSRQILEAIESSPGVQAVSAAQAGFATGVPRTCCLAVEGFAHPPDEVRDVKSFGVSPGYFTTIGLRLLAGRDFSPEEASDRGRRPGVAIVNEAFVRRYLAGTDPLGRRLGWGDPPNVKYDMEIVGVVRDAVYEGPRQGAVPVVYGPAVFGTVFVVRTTGSPDVMIGPLRERIRTVDTTLDVGIGQVSDAIERAITQEKLLARLSTFFGMLAATLAAIGLYGVMAYAVVQRTKELGIRLALGAQSTSVLRMEIRSALRLAAMGIAVGVPAALVAGRAISSQLFGISPADPATIGGVAIVLALVAAAAAYVPARRASHVDPMVALRYE